MVFMQPWISCPVISVAWMVPESLAHSAAPYPSQTLIAPHNKRSLPGPGVKASLIPLDSLSCLIYNTSPPLPDAFNLHFGDLSTWGSFLHIPVFMPLPMLFPPDFQGPAEKSGGKVKSLSTHLQGGRACFILSLGPDSQGGHNPLVSNQSVFFPSTIFEIMGKFLTSL